MKLPKLPMFPPNPEEWYPSEPPKPPLPRWMMRRKEGNPRKIRYWPESLPEEWDKLVEKVGYMWARRAASWTPEPEDFDRYLELKGKADEYKAKGEAVPSEIEDEMRGAYETYIVPRLEEMQRSAEQMREAYRAGVR